MLKLKKITKVLICLISLASLLACATAYDRRGIYHRVRKGDSIWKLAKYYHVSVQDLAEWNNIHDPTEITEGLKLYIPRDKSKKAKKHRKSAKRSKSKGKEKENIEFDRSKFIWPVHGVLFSNFGIRRGRRHDGIDISAKSGTPISAAAKGKVVFNGRMRGYGNMIIIKHRDRFFTVYAHNSSNAVKKGQKVERGDLIGYVGRTGRASGPHVHFEVRQGQVARNPMFFLPSEKSDSIRIVERKSKKSQKTVKRSSKKGKKIEPKKEIEKKGKFSRRQVMMDKLKTKKSK